MEQPHTINYPKTLLCLQTPVKPMHCYFCHLSFVTSPRAEVQLCFLAHIKKKPSVLFLTCFEWSWNVRFSHFNFLFFLSHLKSSHDWSILPSLWNYHAQLGLLLDLKKSKPMNEPSHLVFRTVNLWFLTSTWQQAHVDERKWIGIFKAMMTFYLIILLFLEQNIPSPSLRV